jgi:hypothetical protein
LGIGIYKGSLMRRFAKKATENPEDVLLEIQPFP